MYYRYLKTLKLVKPSLFGQPKLTKSQLAKFFSKS